MLLSAYHCILGTLHNQPGYLLSFYFNVNWLVCKSHWMWLLGKLAVGHITGPMGTTHYFVLSQEGGRI